VDIYIEIGHKASERVKPTEEGFTHDWNVFVRGEEGSGIEHFVDKVVFHLHESFPKPKRGWIILESQLPTSQPN
jgi:YEATS domain-containing protein 1/3